MKIGHRLFHEQNDEKRMKKEKRGEIFSGFSFSGRMKEKRRKLVEQIRSMEENSKQVPDVMIKRRRV